MAEERHHDGPLAGGRGRASVVLLVVVLLLPAAASYLGAATAASADTGPEPVPDGLWDVVPEGVGDQDYVYIEGAEGDRQTEGRDTLFVSDAFGVGDYYGDLGTLVRTGTEDWVGSFSPFAGAPRVEAGYYPVDTDTSTPSPLTPPFMSWWQLGVGECTRTVGWFAVDEIVRDGTFAVKLDLRLEQSCDGGPPIHARIHLDRLPETTTTTSSSTTTTTPEPTTSSSASTSTTAPETTTTTPPPPLSRPPGSPFGSFDVASAGPASVNVAGWAIDPDTSRPIPVHVYVDSDGTAITAEDWRPDVGVAVPGYGSAHGFASQLSAGPGPHTVCAYGINVGVGSNALLGCRRVVVPSGPPVGSLDLVTAAPGRVTASGWVLDWDSGDPISVHVYVDGVGVAVTANGHRPDVGAAFPGWGPSHGFGAEVRLGPGAHTVCAYGINVGPGANALVGCRTVEVPGGSPFGSLDVAVGGAGTVTVAGWAIDPDTSGSIPVHVYVDGVGHVLAATDVRPDVGVAFGAYGPAHGYSATVPAGPGTHSVCAYGINDGLGGNALLGCRTAVVA